MSKILKEKILDGIADEYLNEVMIYGKSREGKRWICTLGKIAACIVVAMGVSFFSLFIAVAAGNMTAYDILYALYPDVAEKLLPVNVACEDEGIRMEVEGMSMENDCAYVYISMQDIEGKRIDESIDLFDSYSIHTNADQIGGCTLVDFDEENNKATFLITVQQMNGAPIEGSAMTFSVSEFLTKKNEIKQELTQINLDTISRVRETQTEERLNMRGCSYVDDVSEEISREYLYVDESKVFVPTSGVKVTNYGIVNDKLHVQVHYEDILQFDNHGFIYLSGKDGKEVLPISNNAFWDEEQKGSYEEYVFDISPDKLREYAVYGEFVTCENLVKGDWEVNFTIKNHE